MKVSFITTVLNEELSIKLLLKSLISQTIIPDEIIIVDGGSKDKTISIVRHYVASFVQKFKNVEFKVFIKKGNRSIGRNEAIKRSDNEIILCSDAGCILDRNWVKNIIEPFNNPKVDVVAGYYKGKPNSVFEKCLTPYVLVMPDKINSSDFLPASRSMAFKKSIWEKIGGFPKGFENNEDYVFAKRLKKYNANIVFEKKAVVHWIPRTNVKDAFIMFYRFAKGDSESRILRPKVVLIFFRYFLGFSLLFLSFFLKSYFMLNTLYVILFIYILWAVAKNYKYVNSWKAFYFLPLIQVVSDLAILAGTVIGFFSKKQ